MENKTTVEMLNNSEDLIKSILKLQGELNKEGVTESQKDNLIYAITGLKAQYDRLNPIVPAPQTLLTPPSKDLKKDGKIF